MSVGLMAITVRQEKSIIHNDRSKDENEKHTRPYPIVSDVVSGVFAIGEIGVSGFNRL